MTHSTPSLSSSQPPHLRTPARQLLAYVGGPYRAPTRAGIEANIQAAKTVAKGLWQMGIPALCPHLNTAHFDGPDDLFLEGDLIMLRRCDLLVLVPGWEESVGTAAEVAAAAAVGIPWYVWPEDRTLIECAAQGWVVEMNHG